MSLDRSTIIRGPAIVTYNSVTFYSAGDITANILAETFDVNVDMYGKVDERWSNAPVEISFTPTQWDSLSVLFPHTTPAIGSSLYGATDKDLVIQTLAGKKLTFRAAAITQMPTITLSTVAPLLGAVTFVAIGTNDEAWTGTSHRLLVETEAFADTSFDETKLYTQAYTVAWGAVDPWDDIQSSDGVVINLNMNITDHNVDSEGLVDKTLGGVDASAALTPVGVDESDVVDLLQVQGASAGRGVSLNGNSNDLNISATGVYVRIYNAAPKEGPLQFGSVTLRAGQLGFIATRSWTGGTIDPLFYVGTTAP